MAALAHDDEPSGLLKRYPSKAERKAAKKARQQQEQQAEPTPAELNTSRMSAAEHEAQKRSAELRAQHYTRGPLPIEVLTMNDYDGQKVYLSPTGEDSVKANLTDMVDHNMATKGTGMKGPALDPMYVEHIATRNFDRLKKQRVVRPAKNPNVWPKLWERANAGDRVAKVAIGRLHNLTVLEIAQQLNVTTRTVDRDIEKIPMLMAELLAHG